MLDKLIKIYLLLTYFAICNFLLFLVSVRMAVSGSSHLMVNREVVSLVVSLFYMTVL